MSDVSDVSDVSKTRLEIGLDEANLVRRAEDLTVAEFVLRSGMPLVNTVLFHSQQAAEKLLKAFLVWHDRPFGKTHNLGQLLAACIAIERNHTTLADAMLVLSAYAVAPWYPDFSPKRTREDAEEVLRLAQRVRVEILARLPMDARP